MPSKKASYDRLLARKSKVLEQKSEAGFTLLLEKLGDGRYAYRLHTKWKKAYGNFFPFFSDPFDSLFGCVLKANIHLKSFVNEWIKENGSQTP